jgi:hypothetical protein
MFPPTYRDLQYADSLEGTDASLMKYRRKTQISQGSSSILLQVLVQRHNINFAPRGTL